MGRLFLCLLLCASFATACIKNPALTPKGDAKAVEDVAQKDGPGPVDGTVELTADATLADVREVGETLADVSPDKPGSPDVPPDDVADTAEIADDLPLAPDLTDLAIEEFELLPETIDPNPELPDLPSEIEEVVSEDIEPVDLVEELPPLPTCGDGDCNGAEDCFQCPEDCFQCCGNGDCEQGIGEMCETCPEDCGPCCIPECTGKFCGSDLCGGSCGECPVGHACAGGACEEYQEKLGDIVITEMMPNPPASVGALGEYIELYNAGDADLNLNGMLIYTPGPGDSIFLLQSAEPPILPAKGHLVFGRSLNPDENGGVPVDFIFSKANFAVDGELTATWDDAIDTVNFAAYSSQPGVAMNLDAGSIDTVSNDNMSAWCNATVEFAPGMKGSPGQPNEECAPVCSDGSCNGAETCETCPADCACGLEAFCYQGDCCVPNCGPGVCGDDGCGSDCGGCALGFACVQGVCTWYTPQDGDVFITEVMYSPDSDLGGPAEWFEIHNGSGVDLDLQGWYFMNTIGGVHYIAGPLPFPAGGHVVLGANADQAFNGGVPVDDAYGGFLASTFKLSASEFIFMYAPPPADGQPPLACELNVEALREEFGFPNGASVMLKPAKYGLSTANVANWCVAADQFSEEVMGTPGQLNTTCQ